MDYTKPLPTPKSISRAGMSVKDFMEYVERIQIWAAENGMFIPDPEDVEVEDD